MDRAIINGIAACLGSTKSFCWYYFCCEGEFCCFCFKRVVDKNEPVPDRVIKHQIKKDMKELMILDHDLRCDRQEVTLV